MTPKPDSRLPWRVVFPKENLGLCQVWTNYDDTLGSRNNYMIADSIQSEAEAQLIAQAPMLQARVQSLTDAKDAALAILERIKGNPDCYPMKDATRTSIREAIEVLKASSKATQSKQDNAKRTQGGLEILRQWNSFPYSPPS